jgi:hypothetical protein
MIVQPRRELWREETPETKLRLIGNDLDDIDRALEAIHHEVRETRVMVRRKLNIIMTIATGLLVALSANLLVLLLTR